MKIDILCSSADHPVNEYLKRWIFEHERDHDISLCREKADLRGGDILFLIHCTEMIDKNTRDRFCRSLVTHASDLPKGRGWSPHIWQVLEGKQEIRVSLLEAEDAVDSGAIWHQNKLVIPQSALWDEVNEALFDAELKLMNFALTAIKDIQPEPQNAEGSITYYRKRTPADSKLDPDLSIRSQFDLMRICDPDRFPAYFELHGQNYKIRLEKMSDD